MSLLSLLLNKSNNFFKNPTDPKLLNSRCIYIMSLLKRVHCSVSPHLCFCRCTGVCVRSREDLANLLQAAPTLKGEATVNWYCYQKPCFLRCFSSADLWGPFHKYIISSPGFIIHPFYHPASIIWLPTSFEWWKVSGALQNFFKMQYLIYVTIFSCSEAFTYVGEKKKVSQRVCGLLDFGAFDTSAQEMVECAAGGEDCQAQTFFSFKYIIILWVSTCPCEVIDRADFLPSYENSAYEYVSTRTLKISYYKKEKT